MRKGAREARSINRAPEAHTFVRQAGGGRRGGPEYWARSHWLAPNERADLFRPLGAGVERRQKAVGEARGRRGPPLLLFGKDKGGASTRSSLVFHESIACGESARIPYWVGVGARTFLGKIRTLWAHNFWGAEPEQ